MKKIQYNGISKLLSGITTKINSLIDIVELKADWEQTDPTAFDYIKNKPDSLDEKVKQENTTTDADYRVLLSKSANDVTENDKAWKNSNLKYNPSTGNLQTTKLNGNTVPSGSGNDTLAKTSDIPDMSDYIEKSLTVGLVKNDGTIDQSDYVESSDLATVATSGSYNDLIDKPTIPAGQVQSDWEQADNTAVDYIKNKPTLATVATSGSYNDLSNKPTIPDELADLSDDENHRLVTDTEKSAWDAKADISDITGAIEDLDVTGASNISAGKTIKAWSETDGKVSITTQNISITKSQISDFPTIPTVNDGKLTINQNGTLKGEFTANDSDDVTVNLTDTTYTASGLVSIDANNNITTTAEVNQNAFAKVKVGSTTVTADAKQDTLELVAGDNVTLTPDATNDKITIVSTDTNTHRPIKLNDTEILGNNTTPLNLKNGNNISMTNSSGTVTINATGIPTKTSDLTNDSNFVSDANYVHTDVNFTSAYETKLSGIEPNAQVNTVTGVKGNSETNYRTGNINITKANIGLSNVPNVTTDNQAPTVTEAGTRANLATGDTLKTIIGKIKKYFTDLKTVAFTGSYNDLTNKPSIPSGQVQSDWAQTDSAEVDYIKNKPTIPTVNNATLTIQKNGTNVQTFTANASANKTANITVPTALADLTEDNTHKFVSQAEKTTWNGKSDFSGSYNDLTDKPTIPTVNNATLTIQKNGTNVQTFTANSNSDKTANITVPMGVFYGTCATAAGTAAKVVTLTNTDGWDLKAGTFIGVRFTKSNTVRTNALTLNVNSSGAKSISWYNGTAYTVSNDNQETALLDFIGGRAGYTNYYVYDGTMWVYVSSDWSRGPFTNYYFENVDATSSTNNVTSNTYQPTMEAVDGSGRRIGRFEVSARTNGSITSGFNAKNYWITQDANNNDVINTASAGIYVAIDNVGTVSYSVTGADKFRNAIGNPERNVRQTLSTTNANYPLLMAYSNNSTTTASVDNVTYRSNSIYANPSDKMITVDSAIYSRWIDALIKPTFWVKKPSSGTGANAGLALDTKGGRWGMFTYPSSNETLYFQYFSDAKLADPSQSTSNTADASFSINGSNNVMSVNIIDTKLQATDISIAENDKLVVTDASDSNKLRRTSLTFDGTTATKALTQKGTFEDMMKVTQTNDTSNNKAYRVLFSNSNDNTTKADTARKNPYLLYNPSGNLLQVGDDSHYGYVTSTYFTARNGLQAGTYVSIGDPSSNIVVLEKDSGVSGSVTVTSPTVSGKLAITDDFKWKKLNSYQGDSGKKLVLPANATELQFVIFMPISPSTTSAMNITITVPTSAITYSESGTNNPTVYQSLRQGFYYATTAFATVNMWVWLRTNDGYIYCKLKEVYQNSTTNQASSTKYDVYYR